MRSACAMKIREVIDNKMLPHIFNMFQTTLLIASLTFNLNFSVIVTGSMANGGLKVVTLFHLWMLFFPAALALMFYRTRREGRAERFMIYLLAATALFSIANVCLHFVNDLILLMKATEIVAWSLYSGLFSISVYRISIAFVLPTLRRHARIKEDMLGNDTKIRT